MILSISSQLHFVIKSMSGGVGFSPINSITLVRSSFVDLASAKCSLKNSWMSFIKFSEHLDIFSTLPNSVRNGSNVEYTISQLTPPVDCPPGIVVGSWGFRETTLDNLKNVHFPSMEEDSRMETNLNTSTIRYVFYRYVFYRCYFPCYCSCRSVNNSLKKDQ